MSSRRFEVDLVKAVGITAVVWIHSMRPSFATDLTPAEHWLGFATKFAVPGFLAATGYLHATSAPIPAAVTRARLGRLLAPYLIASLAAQLFWFVFDGRRASVTELLGELLLASSFGPFYYVLHAVLIVLIAHALAQRRPPASAGALLAATAAAQFVFWVLLLEVPLFWMVRNPLQWLAFFLAGWWLRRHEAAWSERLARQRGWVCLACAALAGAAALLGVGRPDDWLAGATAWLYVWAVLLLLLTLGVGRESRSRVVHFLSDSTYTIYLFHLFFVYPVQRVLPSSAGTFDPVAVGSAWLAGLAGPLLLVVAGRRLLGARSRTLLGS